MNAPHLAQLRDQHAEQGLVVLAVTDEPVPTAMQFAAQQKWDGRIPIAVDERASLRQAYSVDAYPTTVLIDRKGVVRWRAAGATPATIETEVAKLLAEPGPE